MKTTNALAILNQYGKPATANSQSLMKRGYGAVRLINRFRTDIGDAQHIGGARRSKGQAGHDDDTLTNLGETIPRRELTGAIDKVIEVMSVVGQNSMHTPRDRKLAARCRNWRDCQDR